MRYLRFCPPGNNLSAADRIQPLFSAINAQRFRLYDPGTGILLDESMSQFEPFCEYAPESIPWLAKIARKPRGIGSEIKNAACAKLGVLIKLELQEGKEEMNKKEFCDK